MKGLNKKVNGMFQKILVGTCIKVKLSNSMSTSVATIIPAKELRLNKQWAKAATDKEIRRTMEKCVGINTNEICYVKS